MQNSLTIRRLLITSGILILDLVLLSGSILWQDLNGAFESVGSLGIPLYWIVGVVINTFVTLWLVRLWHPVFASKISQATTLFIAALFSLLWTTWLVFVVPFFFSEIWQPSYNKYVEQTNLTALAQLKRSYQEPSYFPSSIPFKGKEQDQESWGSSGYVRLTTRYICKETAPREWLSISFSPTSYKPNTGVYPDAEKLRISDKDAVFYTAVFGKQYSFLVIYDEDATIELSDPCGISKDEFLKVAASLHSAEFTGQPN
jgi:hypothetical protein